jgi:hypothetical protein
MEGGCDGNGVGVGRYGSGTNAGPSEEEATDRTCARCCVGLVGSATTPRRPVGHLYAESEVIVWVLCVKGKCVLAFGLSRAERKTDRAEEERKTEGTRNS